jgi:hypothetical protein
MIRLPAQTAGKRIIDVYGWRVCSVVVVVVDIAGRGVLAVVCSVVMVRVCGDGPPQAASTIMTASVATSIATRMLGFVSTIVRLLNARTLGV